MQITPIETTEIQMFKPVANLNPLFLFYDHVFEIFYFDSTPMQVHTGQ